ncbi:lytic transglycosylase [Streptomyces sp. CBMA29]|uniref:lytic transglycosylase n=1 Tax=Streptomyces sp. CBMA29 TaxID=1896314 RepID=UPI0016619E93|nr:lytic transglycosylase [Streptomyces sp. CBMA29]MBD0734558.1 lytic transglycosylase [Streptomyces sp. CBMA29]
MQLPTIPKIGRLTKTHKITAAGAVAATAVVLAVTGLQGTGGTASAAVGDPTGFQVSTGEQVKSIQAQAGIASERAITEATAKKKAAAEAARKKAADEAAAKKKAAADAAAKKKAAADAAAKKAAADAAAKKKAAADAAAQRAKDTAAANRSTTRTAVQATPQASTTASTTATTTYTNDLDGWIKQSLAIMAQKGIPGSYDGIYRNIMRESSGNPQAINLWDSNAAAGIPSKGLLQTIDPTFQSYHVDGTSWDIYDPVANITAACNYAAANYGSIDNVDSAY